VDSPMQRILYASGSAARSSDAAPP
jgi:hypothetical protein